MKSLHPYSVFLLKTGFRCACALLAEGFLLYLWCRRFCFFRLGATFGVASLALRILLLCWFGGLIAQYLLRSD